MQNLFNLQNGVAQTILDNGQIAMQKWVLITNYGPDQLIVKCYDAAIIYLNRNISAGQAIEVLGRRVEISVAANQKAFGFWTTTDQN